MLSLLTAGGCLLVIWAIALSQRIFNYQRGDFVPAAFQPSGGALSTLNIKSHSVDFEPILIDVSNSGTGGTRARIAGLLDIKGTVEASLDLDAPPWAAVPGVLPGFKGICVFGTTALKGIQVPCRVAKLHIASAIDKELMWSFDVQADAFAGLLVYPAL